MNKIIPLKGEQWKMYSFPAHLNIRRQYAFSSLGRVASFKEGFDIDGQFLKGAKNHGYLTLNLRGKGKTVFIHRIIAQLFLPKPGSDHQYVIHLDHIRHHNVVSNLQWVTATELKLHRRSSPGLVALRTRQRLNRGTGQKQTRMKKIDRLNFERRIQRIRAIAAAIDCQ